MSAAQDQRNIRKTFAKLSGLAIVMFVFAVWIMPPMYDLFCEVTGLNGKTRGKYEPVAAVVDTSRVVRVQFVAVNNERMPWAFKPNDFVIEVHPGEAVNTHFLAHNPTSNVMVGQAVPSLVPSNATDYFHKTECFCFNKQILSPGEHAELGLQFIVDQEIPRRVDTITLSYSLFDVTEMSPEDVKARERQLGAENTDQQLFTAQSN